MIEYIIGRNSSNIRADRFLLKATTAPSSLIYKAFRKKDVKVNGKWIKEDYVLSAGDILRIYGQLMYVPTVTFPSIIQLKVDN